MGGKKVGGGVQDGGNLMPIHVAVWQKPSQYCKLFGRMALKHVQYHIGNESPIQVRCWIQEAWGWCTGMTQRDGMGREERGGFRMGNTFTPVVNAC